jgi:hypothetical protein
MTTILCFSHLRWNFVYQRPQHLMSRFAKITRVYFIEEPVFDTSRNEFDVTNSADDNVTVLVPHLESREDVNARLAIMLKEFLEANELYDFISWYYSPMALSYSYFLKPRIVVYDCMDELSGFNFAPVELKEKEKELLAIANVVFTGGRTLYEAKKKHHDFIFPFPSSIDKDHFLKARTNLAEPDDQVSIKHPRLGFYGVIDERFDTALVEEIASLRPEWQIILIGPVVKIDPAILPRNTNIHYLGGKKYNDLPAYLSGWDIAIMPFALNESTKYISPTKTPEYLCGGKPVISTPISDVVNDYGKKGLVAIARTAKEFVAKAELLFASQNKENWLLAVDEHLRNLSWDNTWEQMIDCMENAIQRKNKTSLKIKNYV